MRTKQEILEQAILNNDMSVIEDYYLLMYEEEPPPRCKDQQPSHAIDCIKKAFDDAMESMETLQDIIYGNVDEYESVDPELDRLNESLNKPTPERLAKNVIDSSIAPAESEGDVVFISSNDYSFPEFDNEEYTDAMKKRSTTSKKRRTRPKYKPNMVACESCQTKFDFNKEYPAGRLESSSKIMCNKCRAHGA